MAEQVSFCKRNAKSIENFITKTYNLDVKFSNVFSWGYNSASIYILDKNDNAYVARVREYNKTVKEKLNKEIFFADYFKTLFRTPSFVKTSKGEYITYFKGHSILIHKHISGVAPFDMDLEILGKACEIAYRVHQLKIPDYPLQKYSTKASYKPKLLHGDITPYNLLTENNDLVALLDYEEIMIGPLERDLARLVLISWFKLAETSDILISTCVNVAVKSYPGQVNEAMLIQIIHEQLNERINNIKKHKKNYKSALAYKQEMAYVEQFLARMDI